MAMAMRRCMFHSNRILWWFLPVLGVWYLSGCAHIMREKLPNVVYVGSEPDSAVVYIDGMYHGITPLKTYLPSKSSYIVEMNKQGYQPRRDTVSSIISSPWLFLDVITSFCILPPLVDAYTGAWFTPSDSVIFRGLTPASDTAQPIFRPVSPQPLNTFSIVSFFDPDKLRETPIIAFIGCGYSFPSPFSTAVPLLPTAYCLGIGYKFTPDISIGAMWNVSVIGKHVLLPTPTLDDATRVKVTPTLSVFSVDGRMRLYHSPLYVVAGIGLLAAGMAENGIQTPGRRRLPEIFGTAGCVSFGMGISFRNGSFFTEARTTIGWNSVHSAPYNPFSVNHFCINLGYYLDR